MGLRQHMKDHHHGARTRDLALEHARDHHRYASILDHYHAGVNRGADQRPLGWKTGEDVVVK